MPIENDADALTKALKNEATKKADDLINHMIQFRPTFIEKLLINKEGVIGSFFLLRKGLIKEFLDNS